MPRTAEKHLTTIPDQLRGNVVRGVNTQPVLADSLFLIGKELALSVMGFRSVFSPQFTWLQYRDVTCADSIEVCYIHELVLKNERPKNVLAM